VERDDWPAETFEQHRGRLKAVANRILGSSAEAEDAVQETWLRLSRADTSAVENLGAWLTTVISRVCLNMLQARRARPETPMGPNLSEEAPRDVGTGAAGAAPDPEQEALLAESVGLALLVVLDTLAPAERVCLVLHDMFGVPFEQIAPIVARNPAAARQLASRARRRVRGHDTPRAEADRVRQARLVDAFMAAARRGDFEALLAVLDPGVVMRADRSAVAMGAAAETCGGHAVAAFLKRARAAQPVFVDGDAAAAWFRDGRLRVVFRFTTRSDLIVGIDLVAEPASLAEIRLRVPEEPPSPRSGVNAPIRGAARRIS
jgi:RNA polymerase sigma-70 factor (ECF subfamily)